MLANEEKHTFIDDNVNEETDGADNNVDDDDYEDDHHKDLDNNTVDE